MKATSDQFSIPFTWATNGDAFPADAPKTFAYDGSGNLSTVTVSFNGDTFVQTLTYTAGKLTADSGFVKQ